MYAVFHFFSWPLSCFVWSVIRSHYCCRCRFSFFQTGFMKVCCNNRLPLPHPVFLQKRTQIPTMSKCSPLSPSRSSLLLSSFSSSSLLFLPPSLSIFFVSFHPLPSAGGRVTRGPARIFHQEKKPKTSDNCNSGSSQLHSNHTHTHFHWDS